MRKPLAFRKRIKIEDVYREGITKVRSEDMEAANDLGYKIKLIASAYLDDKGRADVRVHPMLVSKKSTLAHIDYVTLRSGRRRVPDRKLCRR